MNKVLDRFKSDMKLLSDGILIPFDQHIYKYIGRLLCVIADNVGANEIGGFMAITANRFCRFCKATKPERTNKFNQNQFELRTPQSYDQIVEIIEGDDELQRLYGLKENSPLNSLNDFHICWRTPSDIAHDLHEGFCVDLLNKEFD